MILIYTCLKFTIYLFLLLTPDECSLEVQLLMYLRIKCLFKEKGLKSVFKSFHC